MCEWSWLGKAATLALPKHASMDLCPYRLEPTRCVPVATYAEMVAGNLGTIIKAHMMHARRCFITSRLFIWTLTAKVLSCKRRKSAFTDIIRIRLSLSVILKEEGHGRLHANIGMVLPHRWRVKVAMTNPQ